ncbi:MAG TPA: efflux RND transporter periplasmic adaptor subunit [Aliidongia sp.]|nr:efflux RND transporter periplasmic adaptor subunit [Aliidongia sp.]
MPDSLQPDSENAVDSRTRRALPPRLQWTLLGGLATLIGVAFILVPAVRGLASDPETSNAAPSTPAGTFRPTAEQFAGLTLAPVETHLFRTAEVTDGKIAIDDDKTTPVFSPYSGRVTRLLVRPGDLVKQGQPLFVLDASEFVQAQNDLSTAVATVNSTRALLNAAQTTEKRQHDLFDAQAGAHKDWQQSQADLAAAQANYRSAEAGLAAVRNRLRILGKDDKEVAELEASGKMSPEAVVTAPIGGTVIMRQIGLGQFIQSGASGPVFSIGDLSTVWLVANVREADAPAMRVGEPVEVKLQAFPDRLFKAKLSWVASSVDATTRRLPVRAEIDNPDGALKPEMFARFSIITGGEATVAAAPESAVVYEGDEARVWVARDDGLVALRKIRTGRIADGMVEILSGLEPGEKIVTGGALFIDRAADAG